MKIFFIALSLSLCASAHADVVTSRKAFAFTENGILIPHRVYAEETKNPAVREAQLLQAMTREINSGAMNLVEVETVYKDGYLVEVMITRLGTKGDGNRIRVAVVTRTQTRGVFQDTVERYQYATEEIPRSDLLASARVIDYSVSTETVVALEAYYREPSAKAGLQQAAFTLLPPKLK